MIEREIFACAFKPKGCLFFPSSITELCLRLGVEISSTDEMLHNTGAISITAIKGFAQPAGKSVPNEVPKSGASGDLAARIQYLNDLIEHNVKQQHDFWEFAKAAHTRQKRVFELNLKHKIMNPPLFPEHILQPSVPMQSEAVAPSHAPEDEPAPDSETKETPSPPPLLKTKKASPSRKGKEKVTKHVSEVEDEFDFEVTPSPSPAR